MAIAGALLVAILGTVLTVTYSRQNHAAPPAVQHQSVIAWNGGIPGALAPAPAAPEPVRAPNGLRSCAASDFTVVSWQSAPSGDSILTSYVLQSTAGSPCSVSVYELPTQLIDSVGRSVPEVPIQRAFVSPSLLLVKPGQMVQSSVRWQSGTAPTTGPAELVIFRAAAGGGLHIPISTRTSPTVSAGASSTSPPSPRFSWYGLGATIIDAGSLASLTATITAPASIELGSTMRYTVSVNNPTSVPVSLEPCPTVDQQLSVTPAKQTYTAEIHGPLDCIAAGTSIAAHSSVIFSYELPVGDLPTGHGAVIWSLITANKTVLTATADVAVTG